MSDDDLPKIGPGMPCVYYPDGMATDRRIKAGDFRLVGHLLWHAQEPESCWRSTADLARDMRRSERTIQPT